MRFSWVLLLPIMLQAMPGYHEPWGKDAHLAVHEAPAPSPASSIGVRIAERIIRFHQEVISPVDGPRSHFRPSSSNYMKEAMQKYGFLKGFALGCDRLMRENGDPWVYKTVETPEGLFKYNPVP
ncbi:MAG: hypothetical protein RLZZ453_724 [Chlamydiota bacterium]|jgi:putative component of membrane protein insertase Oxa1/YidC/SpoIIIJ protein YidD